MKNQYLADIGDYGKYSLLRFLASEGIHIGINWYLTEDDSTNDGKFKEYLDRPRERWMCDEELFEELKKLKGITVNAVEEKALIPGAVYYSEGLDTAGLLPQARCDAREKWFSESLDVLQPAELVFADPDNGISYRVTKRMKNNEKYILPCEIKAYLDQGKDVVFYCHKGRRSDAAWLKVRTDLKAYLGNACLLTLTFHKGTQRSYIFALHPERVSKYFRLLRSFTDSEWRKVFDLEPVV